jgi:hypothetical protein
MRLTALSFQSFAFVAATTAQTIALIAVATRVPLPTLQRVTALGSAERARDVILTLVPRLVPPTNSLFHLHPEPG